jgi:hypothetical protein
MVARNLDNFNSMVKILLAPLERQEGKKSRENTKGRKKKENKDERKGRKGNLLSMWGTHNGKEEKGAIKHQDFIA